MLDNRERTLWIDFDFLCYIKSNVTYPRDELFMTLCAVLCCAAHGLLVSDPNTKL